SVLGKGIIVPRRAVVAGFAAVLLASIGAPAYAAGQGSGAPTSGFTQINQVSDQAGKANLTDGDLVNSWGLALSPTSPLWSANNGTNTATLYSGGLGGASVGKVGLTVSIDGGAPTGQVFNGTSDFVVRNSDGLGGPARFIFDSE